MANKILINGKATDQIAILDRGLQYGDGLFETIAVFQNELLCWDEHIARLVQGCERLKLPVPDLQQVKSEALSFSSSAGNAVLKIILTRGQGGRGYAPPDKTDVTRIIALYPWPNHPAENTNSGINTRLCQFRYSQNPVLAGIKHLNRLEQVLARSEWNDSSISEGIVMDTDGNIIEGTMSNVFYGKGNTLFTPDLSACGIEGIARQKIIELSGALSIEINIKKIALQELLDADEIFICNSIIGIWPVKKIDAQEYQSGKITTQIKEKLIERQIIAPIC